MTIKKQIEKLINKISSKDWKEFRYILKDEKGYEDRHEFVRNSYDFGSDDPYDSLNWSAGYISGLKEALEIIKENGK